MNTIPYELAKELKDAGFPQALKEAVRDCFYYDEKGLLKVWPWGDAEPDLTGFTKAPSLSEIIEACGEEFDCLMKQDGFWVVNHTNDAHGPTPEIAVARLYLATLESSKSEDKVMGDFSNGVTICGSVVSEDDHGNTERCGNTPPCKLHTPPSEEKKEIQDPVLRLLLETFEKLSEEDKKKIRDGMDTKLREIGHGHVKNLVSYLGTQGKCCEKCFATSQVFGFCSNKDCPCHAPSEEKKCCEKCLQYGGNGTAQAVAVAYCSKPDCPCHSPTQEEKKLDYMMSPGNMKQVEAEYKCKCNGPIRCFEHLIFPASPTPPDAWEKLTSYINEQLQESHNEGTYKYDWLYEDILKKIEELRANP